MKELLLCWNGSQCARTLSLLLLGLHPLTWFLLLWHHLQIGKEQAPPAKVRRKPKPDDERSTCEGSACEKVEHCSTCSSCSSLAISKAGGTCASPRRRCQGQSSLTIGAGQLQSRSAVVPVLLELHGRERVHPPFAMSSLQSSVSPQHAG